MALPHVQPSGLTEDRIAAIFNADRIKPLMQMGRIPPEAEAGFGDDVRTAVREYARRRETPPNGTSREIEVLHKLAARGDINGVAAALGRASSTTRHILASRLELPGFCDIQNPIETKAMCEAIVMVTRIGQYWTVGRMRPTGRRSITKRPRLAALPMQTHPPIRQAERTLALWLRWACWRATGRPPARSAHHWKRGPFVRVLQECLKLVGAPHVDAAEIVRTLPIPPPKNDGYGPVTSRLLNHDDEDRA